MFRYCILFLFAICHLLSAVCHSQTVTIKGKADTGYLSETNTIYVLTHDDYISYREKELAKSQIDEHGNFNLSFPVSQPTYIFLLVDNAKAEMIAEPNKIYEISFLAKDTDAVNTLSVTVPVEIEFNNSEPSELNYLMADFTNRYEAFLEYHRPLIAGKDPAIFEKIDTMQILCKEKYSSYNKPYLTNYINYTFASLTESITLKEKRKMFEKYLAGKPIMLNNYDYMTFFNQFFSATASHFMTTDKMPGEINNKQNFSSLLDYFKQSQLLGNDTIREAVALKSLAEYFRYPVYKTNAVLAILDQASVQCKAEDNRKAAANLKKKISVMKVGALAPQFFFKDMEGEPVSLADFKGKYVYLNFWATWCSSCIQEMLLIPELRKIYGGKITFVSISVDKKQDVMRNFLKKIPPFNSDKNETGWTFLYCDNFKKAKEAFNVLTVPTYYLIDPKGNVLKSPADKPQNMEPAFYEIKKRK